MAVAALALVPVQLAQAQAQFTVHIFADETGKGTFTNSNGLNQSLSSSMAADPGPGGLSSALTFDLLNPPGLTAGDVFLLELDEAGVVGAMCFSIRTIDPTVGVADRRPITSTE
jgi:hypothetical protein